jgi:Holliday junction resolvasome RuvABC endonuclease subunit
MGFHPHSHGFAWSVFEGPLAPYDWGFVSSRASQRRAKNLVCLRRVEVLLKRFSPEVLVLEEFERGSRRRPRIARLCRAVVALATERGIQVAIFSRAHIRSTFANVGAVTRQEIAEAVARHLEPFQQHLPPRRRAWQPEDERMALFAAAAVLLTHFRLGL